MKTTLVLTALATILGVATGVGSAYMRFGQPVAIYRFSKPGVAVNSATAQRAQVRARAEVKGANEFDFGIMSRNERRSHPFTVVNRGNSDLEIAFVDKSCQCTDVTISQTVVPPGEETEIVLSWQPSSFNPKFEQTARFKTNDPGRLELDLTVKGKVLQIVQLAPRSISFENIGKGQSRTGSCLLFAFRDQDLKVDQTEWLYPETAEFFDVETRPVDPETLANETGALAGWEIAVTLKAGMPVGKFQQRLRLHLNHADLGIREIPILGSIASDIGIFGPGYNGQYWNLDMLSGDKVHERSLKIVVKGKHENPVEMRVAAVDPADVLEAEITAPKSGSVYTLNLKVKPNGSVVNRLGSQQGELAILEIETNLSDSPNIRIPVAFGIESNLRAP